MSVHINKAATPILWKLDGVPIVPKKIKATRVVDFEKKMNRKKF